MVDPTSAQHLAWAEQNEKIFNAIRAKWPDWAATLLFYVAVHEVQALIVDAASERPETHKERNILIRKHWRGTVWGPYEHLSQLSRNARYDCHTPTVGELNNAVLALTKFRMAVAAVRVGMP
ncbi:MAG: hypothetical protein ACR2G9_08860 [Gaiellaceae bacterium]